MGYFVAGALTLLLGILIGASLVRSTIESVNNQKDKN